MVWLLGLSFGAGSVAGLAYYPLALIGLAPLMTLLRDRGASVWVSGIYHGTSNAVGIVLFGEMSQQRSPEFADLVLLLPMWVLIAAYRHKFAGRAAETGG
jgi:uncharacterized membrane protein